MADSSDNSDSADGSNRVTAARTREAAHNPSIKLAVDALRALEAANNPSIKLAVDALSNPALARTLRMLEAANNPSIKLAMDAVKNSGWAGTLRMLEAANNPSIKLAMDALKNSGWAGTLRMLEAANNPSTKLAVDALKNSGWTLRMLEAANIPSIKLAVDALKSPAWARALEAANKPSIKLAVDALKGLTWARTLEPADSSSVKLAREMLKTLEGLKDAQTVFREPLDDPMAKLALASAEFVPEMSEAEFVSASVSYLEQVAEAIRSYLPTLQSLPVLAKTIDRIIILALTILATYYVSNSATSADIGNLKASVDRQTEAVERVERKFAEVLALAERLIQERLAQMAPRHLYLAKRSITARAKRSMKSPITGIITEGSSVAVLSFDRKWIEVEFFDPLSGRAARGWVTKKNFRRQT